MRLLGGDVAVMFAVGYRRLTPKSDHVKCHAYYTDRVRRAVRDVIDILIY